AGVEARVFVCVGVVRPWACSLGDPASASLPGHEDAMGTKAVRDPSKQGWHEGEPIAARAARLAQSSALRGRCQRRGLSINTARRSPAVCLRGLPIAKTHTAEPVGVKSPAGA